MSGNRTAAMHSVNAMRNAGRAALIAQFEADIDAVECELRQRQFRPRMRRCLCGCGKSFLSEWEGQRFIYNGKNDDHRKNAEAGAHALHLA